MKRRIMKRDVYQRGVKGKTYMLLMKWQENDYILSLTIQIFIIRV